MKEWMLDYSLWIYGLMFGLISFGFTFLEAKKTNKETCTVIHSAADKRLESMDKKLDKLIDIHLNGN